MINKCHQSRDSPTDKSEYKEDANDDLNNEVDKDGADEEEEDCSNNNNSNEEDADKEEHKEEDEKKGADERSLLMGKFLTGKLFARHQHQ